MPSSKNADATPTRVRPPCACATVRMASRRISQLYDDAIGESGIKITQRALLVRIGSKGSISVGSLAALVFMDPGALAHTLKPLARDGLVTSTQDPLDRRSKLISLTSKGRSAIRKSDAAWGKAQRAFEETIGPHDTKTFWKVLDRLLAPAFQRDFERSLTAPHEDQPTP